MLLVKLPPMLAEQWRKQPPGASLGTMLSKGGRSTGMVLACNEGALDGGANILQYNVRAAPPARPLLPTLAVSWCGVRSNSGCASARVGGQMMAAQTFGTDAKTGVAGLHIMSQLKPVPSLHPTAHVSITCPATPTRLPVHCTVEPDISAMPHGLCFLRHISGVLTAHACVGLQAGDDAWFGSAGGR